MDDTDGGTSILVASIDAVAISPADAQKFIDNRRGRRLKRYPDESPDITQFNLSHEIITHYAQMAAGTSAVAAVPGAWPGVGTAIVLGVTAAEMPVGMKYQLDMTRCLMVLHGYDLSTEDAKYLSLVLTLSGMVEKTGDVAIQIGTKAGVRMIRKYLKGALLTLIKELFKKVGITFTRKSLERAVPIGGIFLSAGTSYALTKFVGGKVLDYLCLAPEVDGDSPEADEPSPAMA